MMEDNEEKRDIYGMLMRNEKMIKYERKKNEEWKRKVLDNKREKRMERRYDEEWMGGDWNLKNVGDENWEIKENDGGLGRKDL